MLMPCCSLTARTDGRRSPGASVPLSIVSTMSSASCS